MFPLSASMVFGVPLEKKYSALGVDFRSATEGWTTVDVGLEEPLLIEQRSDVLGGVVWDCARVACGLLGKLPEIVEGRFPEGTRVLELGCGTGVVGLACAGRGASVLCTDQSPELATTNARGKLRVQKFLWGETSLQENFHIVVGSDCLYDPKALPSLLKTLLALTTQDTVLYIAYKRRRDDTEAPFFKALETHFEHVAFTHPNNIAPPYDNKGLYLCRIAHKRSIIDER